MATATFVKKARKPNPVVSRKDINRANKGEEGAASYYTWKFRFGGRHYSKTPPRPSQLTQSEFTSGVLALQEAMGDAKPETIEDLENLRDEWAAEAREIGDTVRGNFENLPEGLQQGDTGQLLEQRAEAMENWASELEQIDFEYDGGLDKDGEPMNTDHLSDWLSEKLGEIQGIEPEI